MTVGDFYEDDEPVRHVIEAFEHGAKLTTAPRSGTWTLGVPTVTVYRDFSDLWRWATLAT